MQKVTEKSIPNPGTTTYDTAASCTKDPLIMIKLLAFVSIAKRVTPFLVKYQTDNPMLSFIANDLERMLSGQYAVYMYIIFLTFITKAIHMCSICSKS